MGDLVVLYRTGDNEICDAVRATSERRLARREAERADELAHLAKSAKDANEARALRVQLLNEMTLLWVQRPSRWRVLARWRWSKRFAKAVNAIVWNLLPEAP